MITNGGKWHYLAIRSLSALFRGIASNHNGNFYCLNCCHSYSTQKRLQIHEEVCNNHDYCHVELPKEYNKILKYSHEEKSLKAPFIIEFDTEAILKKYILAKIIRKIFLQKKKLSMSHQVAHCLKLVHFMLQRTNTIIKEERTVLNGFVKSLKSLQWK